MIEININQGLAQDDNTCFKTTIDFQVSRLPISWLSNEYSYENFCCCHLDSWF
jgi:hypothetical protein